MKTPNKIYIPKPSEFCRDKLFNGPGWAVRSFPNEEYTNAQNDFIDILGDLIYGRTCMGIQDYNDSLKISKKELAATYLEAANIMGYELDPTVE